MRDHVLATCGVALQLAPDKQPAVILLDITMPRMNGSEVSRRPRRFHHEHIPIIVMSAQDRWRAAGSLLPVNDRLPKPFEIATLYAKVARWARLVSGLESSAAGGPPRYRDGGTTRTSARRWGRGAASSNGLVLQSMGRSLPPPLLQNRACGLSPHTAPQ